jgi:hypothetical protein
MYKISSFVLCAFLVLATTTDALAYGDPASGGFVIQAVLAGAFAGVALLKGQFGRIMYALKAKSANKSESA